jgi:hypothetical protein
VRLRHLIAPALAGLLLVAGTAEAKKFRYAEGPKAPSDTALSEPEVSIEPIVRPRGPRVPATNLQLVTIVANEAFDRALRSAPFPEGGHVVVAPASEHPLNFVAEHAILRHLSRRGITTTMRRTVVPDDSLLALTANPGEPLLEYQLASARVTYLRLVGWLPGRVKIERQALVEGKLTLRDPRTADVLWVGDASYSLVDAFPRGQLSLVEDARYTDLKSPPPTRNVDKVFEPVLVVAVVIGLVALFFENRP